MKLRNKKTGEVFDVAFHSSYKEGKITIGVEEEADPVYPKCNFGNYDSLKEFCKNWEDAPEPLIEDEVVRNIIRVWSENKGIHKVVFDRRFFRLKSGNSVISIWGGLKLEDKQTYTIEELCGDEDNNQIER